MQALQRRRDWKLQRRRLRDLRHSGNVQYLRRGSYYGGHAWGEWSSAGNGTHTRSCTNYCREVDTAKCTGGKATCTTKAVCEVCDAEYGEKTPNNHDLVQHAAKAPTCTEKGWDAYDTCSRCDHTTYTELPALNHDLKQYAAKAPTCTEIGWDAYETCSRCDHTTYAELPALNHDYQAVTVEPTCEADGYTIFTCSRCKDSYTADPTDQLGHQFGAWSRTEPALRAPVVCEMAARTLAARIARSSLSALRKAKP